MENKFFQPADFSDFDALVEPPPTKVLTIEKPSFDKLQEMRERLTGEFKRCHTGTSQLSHRAIQASTAVPTINFMEIMFNNFNEKTVLEFIDLVKQDYGFVVAEWAAKDIFSPFVPSVLSKVDRG